MSGHLRIHTLLLFIIFSWIQVGHAAQKVYLVKADKLLSNIQRRPYQNLGDYQRTYEDPYDYQAGYQQHYDPDYYPQDEYEFHDYYRPGLHIQPEYDQRPRPWRTMAQRPHIEEFDDDDDDEEDDINRPYGALAGFQADKNRPKPYVSSKPNEDNKPYGALAHSPNKEEFDAGLTGGGNNNLSPNRMKKTRTTTVAPTTTPEPRRPILNRIQKFFRNRRVVYMRNI